MLPADITLPPLFKQVGKLVRREVDKLTVSYSFDLRNNTLSTTAVPNPTAGNEHSFLAWRLQSSSDDPVKLRGAQEIQQELEAFEKAQEEDEDA